MFGKQDAVKIIPDIMAFMIHGEQSKTSFLVFNLANMRSRFLLKNASSILIMIGMQLAFHGKHSRIRHSRVLFGNTHL